MTPILITVEGWNICLLMVFFRGSGQKIIAFSFYDGQKQKMNKQNYFEGIAPNVEAALRFYPGWVIRLYLDLGTNTKQLPVLVPLKDY